MKKYLLLFWVAMTSIYALAADYHSLEEIRDQWRSRNIKVPQGGQNPNIVQLLSAFQNAWGAYMVDEVLECAKAPRFTSKKDEELNIEIIVDRKNGYACLDNGGTDSGYMETCMWRRDNGHRLFAVVLGQPVDPMIEFVCFYDYDPKTSTLYPEDGPEQEFRPLSKDAEKSYSLPRKGKDFIISEYEIDLQANINHVFSWDGSRHHFSHVSIDGLKYGYRWFNPKETDYLVEMTKIAFITLPGQEGHFYLLTDDEEDGMIALASYKGDLELVGINDSITCHKMTFYPNGVVTEAEIYQYTSYAYLKDGYVLQMFNEYPSQEQNGPTRVTSDGWDDMTESEVRQMFKSLGQPLQIKPEWRKVKLTSFP